MNVSISFVVMTRRDPPNHDAGSWTEHPDLESALTCAKSVDGEVWQKTTIDNSATLTRLLRRG